MFPQCFGALIRDFEHQIGAVKVTGYFDPCWLRSVNTLAACHW